VRYKVWRSNKDESLHPLCGEARNPSIPCRPLFGTWVRGAEAPRAISTDYV